MKGLRAAGIRIDAAPEATFYCWGDLSGLPEPLNDGMQFLKAALDEKVICVPGEFFDVNPGKRRAGRPSRFRQYARFSFGPDEDTVRTGVERIGRLVRSVNGKQ
jgi:aspartate/methionine/tyrosine aminotransferase